MKRLYRSDIPMLLILFSVAFLSCEKDINNLQFDYKGDELVVNGYVDFAGNTLLEVTRTQHPGLPFFPDSLLIENANVQLINGPQSILLSEIRKGLYFAEGFDLDTTELVRIEVSKDGFKSLNSEPLIYKSVVNIYGKAREITRVVPLPQKNITSVGIEYTFTLRDGMDIGDRYLIYINGMDIEEYEDGSSFYFEPVDLEQFPAECGISYPCIQDECFNGLDIDIFVSFRMSLTDESLLEDEEVFLNLIDIKISKVDESICRSLVLGEHFDFEVPFFVSQPSLNSSNIIGGYGHVVATNSKSVSR